MPYLIIKSPLDREEGEASSNKPFLSDSLKKIEVDKNIFFARDFVSSDFYT